MFIILINYIRVMLGLKGYFNMNFIIRSINLKMDSFGLERLFSKD